MARALNEADGPAPGAVVLTTTDSQAAAEDLASRIVESRLAACVQIVPIASVYRWRGAVQREREWLLLIKTAAARWDELERFIRAAHRYETPEIVLLSIECGSSDYLRWLADESGATAG